MSRALFPPFHHFVQAPQLDYLCHAPLSLAFHVLKAFVAAPFFVLLEVLLHLGYRTEMQERVTKQARINIAEYRAGNPREEQSAVKKMISHREIFAVEMSTANVGAAFSCVHKYTPVPSCVVLIREVWCPIQIYYPMAFSRSHLGFYLALLGYGRRCVLSVADSMYVP